MSSLGSLSEVGLKGVEAERNTRDSLEEFYEKNSKLLEEIAISRQKQEAEAAAAEVRRPLPKLKPAKVTKKLVWKDLNAEASVTQTISNAYKVAESAIKKTMRMRQLMKQSVAPP
mmetsp:Transcript_843/g.1951  ORF Transcript_843/g.1951 Transcript_843/m.1951 type:complete len:115 (+) Transcript_843:892-1236(+)